MHLVTPSSDSVKAFRCIRQYFLLECIDIIDPHKASTMASMHHLRQACPMLRQQCSRIAVPRLQKLARTPSANRGFSSIQATPAPLREQYDQHEKKWQTALARRSSGKATTDGAFDVLRTYAAFAQGASKPPSARTQHLYMHALAQNMAGKAALDVFEQMRTATAASQIPLASWNCAIKACSTAGSSECRTRAYALLDELRAAGLQPDSFTYGALMCVESAPGGLPAEVHTYISFFI